MYLCMSVLMWLCVCVYLGVSLWHFSRTEICLRPSLPLQNFVSAGGNGNAFPKTGNVLAMRIANGSQCAVQLFTFHFRKKLYHLQHLWTVHLCLSSVWNDQRSRKMKVEEVWKKKDMRMSERWRKNVNERALLRRYSINIYMHTFAAIRVSKKGEKATPSPVRGQFYNLLLLSSSLRVCLSVCLSAWQPTSPLVAFGLQLNEGESWKWIWKYGKVFWHLCGPHKFSRLPAHNHSHRPLGESGKEQS